LEGIYTTGIFTGRDTISGHEWKLLAEALFDWKPTAIALRAGPWISERLSGTIFDNQPSSFVGSAQSPSFHYGMAAGIAWKIKKFPIEPELNTHLDLTELSQAGANAWSVGFSLVYHLGGNNHIEAPPFQTSLPSSVIPQHPSIPVRVQFLVNGKGSNGNPPLERVETRVKEYRMVNAPNTSPKVTQWIEESYHLPQLALSSEFPRRSGADLVLFKDSVRLFEKIFPGIAESGSKIDTVVDLDRDSAWQHVLALMNTGENNQLIAELRTGSETVRDTLILPPADTSRAAKTIVKHEFRFELSDNYGRYKGGAQSLDLLLDRMKELLDSTNTIRIEEGVNEQNLAAHAALEKKIAHVLGNREIERAASADAREGFVVIMER
jgi:hypothetical protein